MNEGMENLLQNKRKKKLYQIEKNESTTSYKCSFCWCRCSVSCFSSDYYWISDSFTIFSFYSVAQINDANSSVSDSQRTAVHLLFFAWIIIANAYIGLSGILLSLGNSQSSLNYTIIIDNFWPLWRPFPSSLSRSRSPCSSGMNALTQSLSSHSQSIGDIRATVIDGFIVVFEIRDISFWAFSPYNWQSDWQPRKIGLATAKNKYVLCAIGVWWVRKHDVRFFYFLSSV